MIEKIWKDIEGYENLYRISNYGKVLSLNYRRTGKEKILKLRGNGKGYVTVNFSIGDKYKNFYIHILVAQAFIPNPDNLPEVNHKDGIKNNCYVENLERITNSGNRNQSYRVIKVKHPTIKTVLKFSKNEEFIPEWESA